MQSLMFSFRPETKLQTHFKLRASNCGALKGGAPKGGAPKGGGPKGGPRRVGPGIENPEKWPRRVGWGARVGHRRVGSPKFRAFFSLFPPPGLLVEFWWFLKTGTTIFWGEGSPSPPPAEIFVSASPPQTDIFWGWGRSIVIHISGGGGL